MNQSSIKDSSDRFSKVAHDYYSSAAQKPHHRSLLVRKMPLRSWP